MWAERALGLDALVVRPTSVHGYGRPLTAQLVRYLRRYPFPLVGDGDGPFPFSWVGFVAEGVVRLCETEVHRSNPVVVAEPRTPTAKEFLTAWTEASGQAAKVVRIPRTVAGSVASSLDTLNSHLLSGRLPAGAIELLRYKGWISGIEMEDDLPSTPLADALRACLAPADLPRVNQRDVANP